MADLHLARSRPPRSFLQACTYLSSRPKKKTEMNVYNNSTSTKQGERESCDLSIKLRL